MGMDLGNSKLAEKTSRPRVFRLGGQGVPTCHVLPQIVTMWELSPHHETPAGGLGDSLSMANGYD